MDNIVKGEILDEVWESKPEEKLSTSMVESSRLEGVIELAKERMRKCCAAYQYERLQCVNDRKFVSVISAQWEGPTKVQFENRPMFEVNKCRVAVKRILNEYRNNKVDVRFLPKPPEMDNQELADSIAAIFRADEQDSNASEAYDNMFDESVTGGFGALRLRNVYEDEYDEDNENQRIRIEPIFDADTSVFFDPNSQRADKSDAKWCFVVKQMTREAFKALYGDDPQSWEPNIAKNFSVFEFVSTDTINIAEYYVVEEAIEKKYIYRSLDGEEESFSEEELEESNLDSLGYEFIRLREVKQRRVRKYLVCGDRVLEDYGYIAGKYIPIVPCYGERFYIEGVERCISHIRFVKDIQRIKNMIVSRLAEISSFATVDKPIFLDEQIVGKENEWANDNVNQNAMLTVNAIEDKDGNIMPTGPVGYTKAPSIPEALVGLMQTVEQDIKEILGNQEAAERVTSNISGLAVGKVLNSIAMQSYVYIYNFGQAKKRVGEVYLSMIKDVYVEKGRKMKGMSQLGDVQGIEISKPVKDVETEKIVYKNDFKSASMDVSVDIGPSTASKREGVVQTIITVLPLAPDPKTQQILMNLLMMNMEGEGIDQVRKSFRKDLVRQGVLEPTEEEAKMLAEEQQLQTPTANDQFLIAAANEKQALAKKAEVDTTLSGAKIKETLAKATLTLSEVGKKPNA